MIKYNKLSTYSFIQSITINDQYTIIILSIIINDPYTIILSDQYTINI